MSKKKKMMNETVQLNRTGFSILGIVITYLVILGVAVSILIMLFNHLMSQHDQALTSEICNLVTEKMNNSIYYMTSSAENMASVLSAQKFDSLEEIYQTVSTEHSEDYTSIGFIDAAQHIYATDTEIAEFEKWNLLDTAALADPVSISTPYRSAVSGQPVFTMFSDFSYGSGQHGWLFVTYPLSEVQNMASTESLKSETEIWLMNAASSNIIQCAGTNKYSIGSWNNAQLSMKSINPEYLTAYDNWRNKMLADEPSAILNYQIGSVSYTQIYAKIDYMPGWYVVVRIPSSSLTNTMVTFQYCVMIFIAIILFATMLLFIFMNRQNEQEKQILENLSIHDPLTSAMNRRAFDFTAEQRLSSPAKGAASLLFFDVDYFKQVNDSFGHEAGDRILKEFSAALRELFGEFGYVSRFGGDEFVVLLNTDDKEHVNACLQKLQELVHGIHPCDDPQVYNEFTLSFSAGAACFPKDGSSLKALEHCADNALYIVKRNGRNGFRWYDEVQQTT